MLTTVASFGQPKDSLYTAKRYAPGVRLVPVEGGRCTVWTQQVGQGSVKLLLLHGGPVNTHEYFENFPANLPGVTVYLYDQLGSYYSDQPADTTLWRVDRFVDEVEEVRIALGLNQFYLLGHSWGGLLAMEYALKYPGRLKGLIVSNKSYSQQRSFDTRVAQMDTIAGAYPNGARVMAAVRNWQPVTDTLTLRQIMTQFNRRHLVRLDPPPDALQRNARHVDRKLQNFIINRNKQWTILDRLPQIRVPTLLVGATHDFVSEADLRLMASRIPNSTLYMCPNGSHMAMWDDTENYFRALQLFFKRIE